MRFGIGLLAMVAVLGMTVPVMAAKEKQERKGEPDVVQGQIVSIHVNHADGNLTDIKIATRGKKRGGVEDITFTADAGTKVSIDGQSATLADLKVGERCKVIGSEGRASAIEVAMGKGKGKKQEK